MRVIYDEADGAELSVDYSEEEAERIRQIKNAKKSATQENSQSGETARVSAVVPRELREALQEVAELNDATMSVTMKRILENELTCYYEK
jgi:hypothetical protein